MNNVEESCAKPNEYDGEEVRKVVVGGACNYVKSVTVYLVNGGVITFEPRLEVWDKGINTHICEKKGRVIGTKI